MGKPDSFSKVGIDADIIAYSTSFACQEKSLGDLHNAIDDLINYIVANTVVFPTPTNVAGYLTGKDNFRYDIAVTYGYKANRREVEKPKWLTEAREYMVDKHSFVVVEGQEADDALSIDATNYYDPDAYVIATIDKDLNTVPGWKFNFKKGTFTYWTEHEALLYFYEQCLTGDKADGIIGLFRVGPVKAKKILEGALTEGEMFARVLKAYEESPTLVGKPYDRLVENAKLLHMRRQEGEIWQPPM